MKSIGIIMTLDDVTSLPIVCVGLLNFRRNPTQIYNWARAHYAIRIRCLENCQPVRYVRACLIVEMLGHGCIQNWDMVIARIGTRLCREFGHMVYSKLIQIYQV